MKNTKHQPLLNSITLAIFLCFSANSVADGFRLQDANTKKVKKAKWVCKYCPATAGTMAKISPKLTNTTDDNGQFATNAGDKNEGSSVHLDADIDKRAQGRHYRFQATGIGKDNTNIALLAANSGSYKATLNYKTINQFGHGQALSPFTNAGSPSLQLPGDWQQTTTASAMPAGSFSRFSEQLERESWQLALEKQFANNWQGYVDFKSENKQGIKSTSGNILSKVVMLPTGIDQKHQQVDVGSYFSYEQGTLLLNYYRSDYSNNRTSVNWRSPYTALFGGADSGQLSTTPDNQFDQIRLFGNYRTNQLSIQARINYGQQTQTSSYLPYSNNALLDINATPVSHLDGKINTLSSHVKVLYKTDNKWRITLDYHLDDRDNKTQSNAYQKVLTDSVVLNDFVVNRAYSFKKKRLSLQSQYRFAIGSQLAMGWQYDQRERNLQDRNETENEKFWFKVSSRLAPFNRVSFELSREFRDGSRYNRTDQITPINDTLRLQKYNQSDREREQAKGQLSLSPFSKAQTHALANTEFNLQAYFSRDKYQQTDIGLVESKRRGIDLSVSTSFNKHVSLLIYTHNQWQDNISQGSYWFNAIDWIGNQGDKSDSVGINLVAEKLSDGKLTLGADYSYSYAAGTTQVNSLSLNASEDHNELVVNSQDVKLYADYQYSTDLSLHIDVMYQKFDEQDWRFEYDIDRIGNVLGNGLLNYNYDTFRLTTGISYQF